MVGRHDPTSREAVRDRLRLAFERSGLTQAELAQRCAAATGTVSDWFNPEKGAVPDGERMARLPAALNVSGHWLLTGEGPTVASGEGAIKRAERAGAAAVIVDLARALDQLRLIHVAENGSEPAAERAAKRLALTAEQADRARATSGRRHKARRAAS